jgi:NADPH:quinone reductase-like Zn-dependent oxidoreductase
VGGETNSQSYKVLKPGGKLLSMVEEKNQDMARKHNIDYIHQNTKVTQKRLAAITQLIETGKLEVKVGKIYSLGMAADALENLKTGRPKGKVVIQVK